MEQISGHEVRTYPLHVDSHGRFVIPAQSKIRKAFRNGEKLVAVENEAGELSIRRYVDVVKEVQAYFKKRIPEDRNLVQELIDDRRREAADE
jgi:bifunctional DNA-binding transcriptional regulator/antitoxin component of YhaV-PrlF toxin-antitoxin module